MIQQDGFQFDLQEWLECRESEAYDSYGNALFVGPKCSESGEQINLGVFKDQYCTVEYSSEIFAKWYGGYKLPYQDENIVAENCVKCSRLQNNNNNNAYYNNNYEMVEMCEEIYPASLKCEENVADKIYYPVTAGCEFIKHIKLYEKDYKPVSAAASTFFAVVFGLSTIFLAGVAANLYRLNSRKIELQTDAAVV